MTYLSTRTNSSTRASNRSNLDFAKPGVATLSVVTVLAVGLTLVIPSFSLAREPGIRESEELDAGAAGLSDRRGARFQQVDGDPRSDGAPTDGARAGDAPEAETPTDPERGQAAVVAGTGTQRAWALEETFDGDPPAPSQELLPRNFDFVATHRTHPQEQFTKVYALYPADHDEECAGPDPDVNPLPQHDVQTVQTSNGDRPDESFFVCKNHMMSSMGEVEAYSLSSFWPRQEFDFSDGGVLEFDVNINLGHTNRHWWEVLIAPRDQLKVAAGPVDAAIDEKYPNDRIVFDFQRNVRRIKVGTGALAPDGWIANERQFLEYDWAYWDELYPGDEALDDRRIRRTMRIRLRPEQITWSIETEDGSFDDFTVEVPDGLPFDRGLVLFKTHAYTPVFSGGNLDTYTFHWDNIRFDGPVGGRYDAYAASDVVYLQANGDRPIGDRETVTIDLPRVGRNPVLFGQVHQPMTGQVLVSVNDGPDLVVHPYEYDRNDCISDDWKSFRLELDPESLHSGINTFEWSIGPHPDCATDMYDWDGYSIKFLQVQMDRGASSEG